MDQKFSAQFSRLIYLMYFNSNLFIKICKKCIYLIATFFCVKKEKKGKLEKSSVNRQPSHLATCLLDYASHTHCGHPTQRTYGKKKHVPGSNLSSRHSAPVIAGHAGWVCLRENIATVCKCEGKINKSKINRFSTKIYK